MLRDATTSNQTTTLIGLKLTCSSKSDVTEAAIASAYAQTTDLISNLVRMQDVVCRWDENIFVLAFLNTVESEAKNILHRIKSLLNCTTYDGGIPLGDALSVSANSTILEIVNHDQSKETYLDSLVANLLQNPDEH